MRSIIGQINKAGKPVHLLVDFSNLCYRMAFTSQRDLVATAYKDWRIFKHKCLNEIIETKRKFANINDVVICIDNKDNGKYWRHDIHPNYKGKRKNQKSPIPKDILLEEFKTLELEIKENLPWKVVKVCGVEADDIIAILSQTLEGDNVIFSPDHDFKQLIRENIFQWDTLKRKFIECKNIRMYKFEMILKGDSGDSIPNILSKLDHFTYPNSRQKSMTKHRIQKLWDISETKGVRYMVQNSLTNDEQKRFVQNRRLVDLSVIPKDIKEKILLDYHGSKALGSVNKFFNWCNRNSMRALVDKINYVGV